MEEHTNKREGLKEQLKMIEKEIEHYAQTKGLITSTVNEVNEQIQSLTSKQNNFKDSATYL